MNNYLKISILAVVISGIVFHEVFYREGEFKDFGLNNEQTILPLWLALVIIGFFVYSVQILNEGKYIV